MHAVILNKNGSQSQRYKLKYRGSSNSDTVESNANSTNSTNCSSINGEGVGIETVIDDHHPAKDKNRAQEKSYILCHIRKIDHNYKITKKRRANTSSEDLYEECMPKLRDSSSLKKIYNGSMKKDEQYSYPKSFPKPMPIQPKEPKIEDNKKFTIYEFCRENQDHKYASFRRFKY